MKDKMPGNDPYNLERFVSAQETVYENVLAELRKGRKQTHWMWFIFPQIEGLGHSPISKYYSVRNRHEAQQYLDHPILGTRLLECTKIILAVSGRSAVEIFGSPDDLKLKSSMTLFASLTDSDSVFRQALEKYFEGERDHKTLEILGIPAQ
jgi:uncharacterized protein (DUF1810 family)